MIRHVLITGGAGFIGTHLARHLVARQDRVVALDDLSAASSAPLPAEAELIVADVRDADAVDAAVDGADLVLHLASVVGVDAVTADPERTGSVIRDGTARVLAAARTRSCPLVFFSTSEVTDAPRRGPRAVYGEAKRDAEHLLLAHAHEVPVTIVRPFNIVGPGQAAPGMVLPRLARAARSGAPLPVHGDGRQERSFLHVDDLVVAVLALLDESPSEGGGIVEIGSEERLAIEDVAARLARRAGRGSSVRRGVGDGQREDRPRRRADLSALRRYVDFTPSRSLDDILDEALAGA